MTPANSSSISDGAAALVLMRESEAKRRKLKPLARIAGVASIAQAPAWFTTAPVGAIKKLLEQVGWSAKDVGLYEINEAFAVVDHGGHARSRACRTRRSTCTAAPARWATRSARRARASSSRCSPPWRSTARRKGVAALCIGGGEATAVAIERMM